MGAPIHFWTVIPAAGSSRRMGAIERPKQYLELCGKLVLEWAAQPFLEHPGCLGVVVAIAQDDAYWPDTALARHRNVVNTVGGADRAQSVRAGLEALNARAADRDWVLVHDAARPCLVAEDLERLLVDVSAESAGGLLAAPMIDTVKRVDEAAYVVETIPRTSLWRALTPQMFRYGVLKRALALAATRGLSVTDESQAVELLGLAPRIVPGSAENLKITLPADLQQAARILERRREMHGE